MSLSLLYLLLGIRYRGPIEWVSLQKIETMKGATLQTVPKSPRLAGGSAIVFSVDMC